MPKKAVPTCRAAVNAAPDDARYRYQLRLALSRLDKRDEAVALIRAAEEGDPGAQDVLVKDDAKALPLYRQAAGGGYAPAFSEVGRAYWDGTGTGIDHAEAARWVRARCEFTPAPHRTVRDRRRSAAARS